jgi:hypothetical protein
MPVPAAPGVMDAPDQWIVVSATVPLPVEFPVCRAIEEPAARPSGHHPSIFHPPPA